MDRKDQIRSLVFWQQQQPERYAEAKARKGKETCPLCLNRYPTLRITLKGEVLADGILCACQCIDIEEYFRNAVDVINNIPKSEKVKGFADIVRRGSPEQWKPMERAIELLQDLIAHPWEHKWLHIWGPPGVGKTHLLLAAQAAMPDLAAYIDSGTLADDLHQAIGTNTVPEVAARLIEVPVLLLDDLGAEYDNSPFVAGQFTNIINRRYLEGRNRPVVLTTNLSGKSLRERYSRLARRVMDVDLVDMALIDLPDYSLRVEPQAGKGMRLPGSKVKNDGA